MPFRLIKGTFHLVGATKAGRLTGFQPDGDSMQFKPANPALSMATAAAARGGRWRRPPTATRRG